MEYILKYNKYKEYYIFINIIINNIIMYISYINIYCIIKNIYI